MTCLGGEDELSCPFNTEGTERRRVSRQNQDQHVLPDGAGNSDIPHNPSIELVTSSEASIIQSTTLIPAISITVPSHTTENPIHTTTPQNPIMILPIETEPVISTTTEPIKITKNPVHITTDLIHTITTPNPIMILSTTTEHEISTTTAPVHIIDLKNEFQCKK